MAVNDFDVMGVTAKPAEANPKLVIDADAVLTDAIAGQLFKSVGGWDLQVGEGGSGI